MGKRMGPRRSKWTEQSPDTQGCCRCVLSTFFPSCLVPGARNGAELCEVPPGLLWPSQTNGRDLFIPWTPPSSYCWQGLGFHSRGSCPADLVQFPFPQAGVCWQHPGWGECSVLCLQTPRRWKNFVQMGSISVSGRVHQIQDQEFCIFLGFCVSPHLSAAGWWCPALAERFTLKRSCG